MSLKRILKLLAAFLTGQGVTIVTQLLVPPLFLHRYAHGVQVYGEWVALTAAVAYLNTLNYGIQSYANNQMGIHYNRGELEEAKAVQASALLLLLVVTLVLSCASATILLMPLGQWLGLEQVSSRAASITVFLLVIQLIVSWGSALLAGSYLAIGEAHRGQNWLSAQRLVSALAMAAFLWERASFPVLALTQLASVVAFLILIAVDIRVHAPILLPALKYGSWRQATAMIRPTGYFMLLAVSSFLTWQGPILLIQRILGSTSVAIFALSRIVFSMSRYFLSIFTFALSQDITHLVGQRNWLQLRRLYELSEKVILLLVPAVTIGTLLMSPLLFTIWLHNRSLFHPGICLLMAMVSAAIAVKEHKYQFQWSSNEHTSLSKFLLAAYSAMLVVAGFLLKPLGIGSLLVVWLVTECVVVAYILRLNVKLFPKELKISQAPVMRLAAVLAAVFALAAWPSRESAHWPLGWVAAAGCASTALLLAADYFIFDLREVRSVFENRLRRRFASVDSV